MPAIFTFASQVSELCTVFLLQAVAAGGWHGWMPWHKHACKADLQEAGVAALLHADADGVQAQQRVGQVGRPLLRLRPGKLQDRQRLAQRLQPVGPADDVSIASDLCPESLQRPQCSSSGARQHTGRMLQPLDHSLSRRM